MSGITRGYSRADRVADLIREEVSRILCREVKDPAIGFITITDVDVSKDLKSAKIFYTILGDEWQARASARALLRVSPFIRRQMGKRLKLLYVPDNAFRYDQSME